jgi:hemolysin-activating ACP:hemolysin acyltransferase
MINVYPIINLYKQFDKYKDNSEDEILSHIYPSLELNQYKIHKENGKIYGFSNWAFLNKEEEDYLLEKNRVYQEAWNSGNIVWHMDIVAKKM